MNVGNFIKIDSAIFFNPNLTTDQKLLYGYLDNKISMSEFREDGLPFFYMSGKEAETICDGLGWSKRTLQRHLSELEEINMIQFERTGRGRRIYKNNFDLLKTKISRIV